MAENILETIVEQKQLEVARLYREQPLNAWQNAALATLESPKWRPRDFLSALRTEEIALIAEVKKASPSQGIIRQDFDPLEIAQAYEKHGANCVSVLTDEKFFQGKLDYLKIIRENISLPVLRKDFIIDPVQVYEARIAGADAVLLIAECLADETLKLLVELIHGLQMTALVEFYEAQNLPKVLAANPRLVGVNNRDLRNFKVDLQHSIRMRQKIENQIVFVSESGIRDFDDVKLLRQNHVQAILVGQSLMEQDDVGEAIDRLLGKQP